MENLGLIYCHFGILRPLVFFMAIWYILWSLGVCLPILVFYTKKNLATLSSSASDGKSLAEDCNQVLLSEAQP
jgi:hypothetical protein